MLHAHVDAAGSQLFEHLFEAFQLGFGSGVVVVHEAVADECVFDELGHGVDRGGDDRDGPLD